MNRLSLLRVVALNALAVSIDLLLAVQGAYFIPAILNFGLSSFYGAMLLSISPLASMFFQSYVGSASDQCQCSWGRRRPFILVLSLASLLGLLLFPFVEDIAKLVSEDSARDAVLISLVIMSAFISDFCGASLIQVPFRAYVLDVLPQKQVVLGNMIYSICLSVGSATGFGIGAVNWSTLFTSSDNFSMQVKFVFGLTLLIMVACTTITLFSVRERDPRSPENRVFAKFDKAGNTPVVTVCGAEVDRESDPGSAIQIESICMQSDDASIKSDDEVDVELGHNENHDGGRASIELSATSSSVSGDVNNVEEDSSITKPDINDSVKSAGYCGCVTNCVQSLIGNLHFQRFMSSPMVILCIAVFFGLLAFFSQVFFFTNYVGEVTYGGDVTAPENSTEYHNYTDGVKFGSLILGVSAIVGLIVSLLLGPLIKLVGMRPLFVTAYVLLMIQSGILSLSPNRVVVFVISPAIAVMNAVVSTFPFILASKYEAMQCMVRKSWPYGNTILLGRACAVLKCAGFAANVMALLINGPLSDVYGSAVSVMIFTFAVSFIGAVIACFVTIPPTSLSSKKKRKCLTQRTNAENPNENEDGKSVTKK
ncbi:membrane-associated transporter protein-like [Dysidea avara]|uniref:membrane-associated transporter protein-like n=1 Tax=Dysidea avara TaxID=196820 RepID=UPI003317D88B